MAQAEPPVLSLDVLLSALKAAGEPTRLRILALLSHGDLSVKDLTTVLGQSQPRISRHLKLLTEAGLIRRFPEGAWAYYRLADQGEGAELARSLTQRLDRADALIGRDRERLESVLAEHQRAASLYFARNAASWDEVRSLHVDEEDVEAAIRKSLGIRPFDTLVDLGTGTGRVLQLLADLYQRGIGVDSSQAMLNVARARLAGAEFSRAQVRHGDLYALPLPKDSADVVVVHQVLHFLADPQAVLKEAARILRPGGRLLVVDFAPHDLEFLRDEHAHRRLGFSDGELSRLFSNAGLETASLTHLASPGHARLTVTLALARDTRIQSDLIPRSLETVA
jgi:ArsR family transcriptional regulator